jgi:integrase
LTTLKSIFNIGIKFGWCLLNPVNGISKLRIPQKEKLCLSDEGVSKLLIALKEDSVMNNIILFGLHTGCRLGELINLQWKDIDSIEGVIHIRNKENFRTKTGMIRHIPVSNKLTEVINKMMKDKDNIINIYNLEGYIFTRPDSKVYSQNSISHKFIAILLFFKDIIFICLTAIF